MHRKGFPESYDRRALLRFVTEVKAGRSVVTTPMYSHLGYDIVPGVRLTVHRSDILLIEGSTCWRPRGRPVPAVERRRSATSSTFGLCRRRSG